MKSLGPDAFINEDSQSKKPIPLSSVINEVLAQFNMPKSDSSPVKPPKEVMMPEKPPQKEPERSTNIPNNLKQTPENHTEPPPTVEQPTRSPGRPSSNTMEHFQVSGKLLDNPKFLKFKRELNLSEKDALAIIVKLFYFTCNHRAMTPTLEDIDLNTLKEILYWEGDPQKLISTLISANFLTKTLEIQNWFQNQPFAAKKLHDKRQYQKKKKQEDN